MSIPACLGPRYTPRGGAHRVIYGLFIGPVPDGMLSLLCPLLYVLIYEVERPGIQIRQPHGIVT